MRICLRRAAACLAVLAVVGAACGDDDDSGGASATTTSNGASTETTQADIAETTQPAVTESTEADSAETTQADSAETTPADIAKPDRIVVASPGLRGMSLFSALEVAAGRGWPALSELGVDVEIQAFGSGSDALAAVLGGDADIIFRGPSGLLAAIAQGEDFTGLLSHYQGAGVVLIAASQYEQERGTDVAAFDGANWGVPALGGIGEAFPKALAEQAGLSWENQSVLPLGGAEGLLAGLTSGQADLVVMDPISAAAALRTGAGYIVANGAGVDTTEELFGPQLGQMAMAPTPFVEEYPEVTEAFVTDVVEAMKFVTDNVEDPNAILEEFPDDVLGEIDREAFADEWELVKTGQAVSPVFDPAIVDNSLQLYVGIGDLTQQDIDALDREKVFNNAYVRAALENLGLTEEDVGG